MRNIFTIPVEDVQYLAMKKFGRKLTFDELYQAKKGEKQGPKTKNRDRHYFLYFSIG